MGEPGTPGSYTINTLYWYDPCGQNFKSMILLKKFLSKDSHFITSTLFNRTIPSMKCAHFHPIGHNMHLIFKYSHNSSKPADWARMRWITHETATNEAACYHSGNATRRSISHSPHPFPDPLVTWARIRFFERVICACLQSAGCLRRPQKPETLYERCESKVNRVCAGFPYIERVHMFVESSLPYLVCINLHKQIWRRHITKVTTLHRYFN